MRSIACSLLAVVLLFVSPYAENAQGRSSPSAGFAAVPFPTGLSPATADLTVRGKTGRPGPLLLDLKTILALPSVTFRTIDPWDGVEYSFTGVSLKDFMAWAGIEADAKSLVLTAKNAYTIPIKRSDYESHAYYIVYAIEGRAFGDDPATKKRGPLAIAIDFTASKDLKTEIYRHQLVWQLSDILAQ